MRRADVCAWVKWPSVNPPIFWNEYKAHFARYQKVCRGFHVKFNPLDYAKTQFCIGCHEMRDNVYQEYKKTIHYSNRTGVRAICSDCHVPKDWTHKLLRKIEASQEVWGKLTGYIDTPEKFESHRMELATHEWDRMKATNSIECRNCHNFEAMSGDIQKQSVYNKHMKAKAEGQTCIDCHKGIAHHLPKEYRDPDE